MGLLKVVWRKGFGRNFLAGHSVAGLGNILSFWATKGNSVTWIPSAVEPQSSWVGEKLAQKHILLWNCSLTV